MLQQFAPRTSRARFTALLPAIAIALGACDDATPPVAPSAAAPDAPRLAKAPTRPTGAGIGVIGSKIKRTSQTMAYHGGPMMLAPKNVYFIWYGNWTGGRTPQILIDFASNLGGSGYFQINSLYRNAVGVGPSGNLSYIGSIFDNYSRGTSFSSSTDAGLVVGALVVNSLLPVDPDGIYVVFTAADVDVPGFGTAYCGFHSTTSTGGVTLRYVFVGHPARAPAKCQPQTVSPNGDAAADAMASVLAAELSNTVTDPEFTAWYDRYGLEPADKCAWSYGTTYTTTNGARPNVRLGGYDFLLQQLWIPKQRGFCALDVSAAGA
jgi:hypothetical protein